MADSTATPRPSVTASVVLFFCFLVICFGLGYPAFSRYDPREAGNPDSRVYYRMILHERANAPACFRLLTPTLARGVHGLVSRFDLGNWDRVLLSLLIVNAAFTSLSALMLMRVAAIVSEDVAAVVLSPFVYLSSFAVVNLHLAGLVDAGEGFFLIALLLALLRDRWWLAPVLIAVGALAKETVVPLGVCAVAVWWVVARVRGKPTSRFSAAAIPLCLVLGLGSIFACRSLVAVPEYPGHQLSWSQLADLPGNLIDCLFTKTQIYVFAFLLPMGIPRLGRIPLPLLGASGGMALLALLLGAYAAIGDNLHRPLFNTLGPALVVSCSIFIANLISKTKPNAKKPPTSNPEPRTLNPGP